jgi:F0F1-type ATP synthase assembly protein I
MVRPPSIEPKAGFVRFFGLWETVLAAPDPDRLNDLGRRLDDFQTKQAAGAARHAPSQSQIGFRFATELFAGVVGGGGIGWGLDWLCGHFGFHTRPVLMIAFFVLGTAAGIRNVMRAAKEINAEIAQGRPSDSGNGKETGS